MFAAQLIGDSFDDLVIGLALNIPVITAIAALAYRRSRARANNIFTLVIINIVVFFVTHVMVVASIGVGVGFGLFALFGILRFRTGTIPTVEMGFLFAGIALAALNAIAPSALGVAEVIIANLLILAVLEGLGGWWLGRQPQTHSILYERVELLRPGRRDELIADLEERTGFEIEGVEVSAVNFLNDTVKLTIRVLPTVEDRVRFMASGDEVVDP
ncbi:MAG: DUF4956 domain-containing protein [Acidimicrobiales bacterium]|jgi:prepilin signal peptidase PulO-like enzyme (type II secretory pathway)